MPKKSRGKFTPIRVSRTLNKYDGSEVFRNSSAVCDDTDPHQSLKYLIDIFKGKIDEDVISMVFSECAYNVDQALETLMSLSSDENVNISEFQNAGSHHSNSRKELYFQPYVNGTKEINSYSVERNPGNNNSTGNKVSHLLSFPNESPSKRNLFKNTSGLAHLPNPSPHSILFSTTNVETEAVSESAAEHSSLMLLNQRFNNSLPEFITPILPNSYSCNGQSPVKNQCRDSPTKDIPLYTKSLPSLPLVSQADVEWKRKAYEIKHAQDLIKSGCRVLIILRGLPGSGKTTLAQKLQFSGVIFSTDDYFFQNGKYYFDPMKLEKAHAWNHNRTRMALSDGITPVIIDNTNTEAWEMVPYVKLGKIFNFAIIILEPNTPWKFNVKELAFKNKHGVPKQKIAKMSTRYQHNITVGSFSNLSNITKPDFNKTPVNSFIKQPHEMLDNNFRLDFSQRVGNAKQSVSLEAVVHQEEKPSDFLPDKSIIHLTNTVPSIPKMLLSNEFPQTSENKNILSTTGSPQCSEKTVVVEGENSICEDLAFKSLDELRSLVLEDSEDSQSLSKEDVLHASDQDISSWEAITEHDDDFLWKIAPPEQTVISCHCKSTPFQNNDALLLDSKDVETVTSKGYSTVSALSQKNKNTSSEDLCSSNNVSHVPNSHLLHIEEAVPSNQKGIYISEVLSKSAECTLENFDSNESIESKNHARIHQLACSNVSPQSIGFNTPQIKDGDYNVNYQKNYHFLNSQSDNFVTSKTCIASKYDDKKDFVFDNKDSSEILLRKLSSRSFDESLVFNERRNQEKDSNVETNLLRSKFYSFPHLEQQFDVNKLFFNNDFTSDELHKSSSSSESKTSNNSIKTEQEKHVFNLDTPLWISDDLDENNSWADCEPQICHADPISKISELKVLTSNKGIDINVMAQGCVSDTKEKYFSSLIHPKPQRSDTKLNLVFSNKFNEDNNSKVNILDLESSPNKENFHDWENSVQTEKISGDSQLNISVTKENLLTPKPQRTILEPTNIKNLNKTPTATRCVQKDKQNSEPVNEQNKLQTKGSSLKRSPLLKQSELFLDKDWLFPQYIQGTLDTVDISEGNTTSYHSSETQTEPSDFVLVYKIETCGVYSSDYCIITASANDYKSNKITYSQSSDIEFNTVVQQVAKFEKSTCTDDLIADTEIFQKMSNLQECFPDISEEDLSHLLSLCLGDETWLINLLLDSGYKYNNPNQEKTNVLNTGEVQENNLKLEDVPVKSSFSQMENSTKHETPTLNENNNFVSSKNSESEVQTSDEQVLNPIEAHVPASRAVQKMNFILAPEFAMQLEELFGPVLPNVPVSSFDRTVEIDLNIAKLIYSKWKSTVQCKTQSNSKDVSDSEEKLKKRLPVKQVKKEIKSMSAVQKDSDEPMSFSEIMDLEYALQIHKNQKLRKDKDFATKLKRMELYNMFPGADTIALDEIFDSNNYSLENSVKALGEDIGEPATVKQERETKKIEENLEEWNKLNTFKDFENDDWSDWVYKEDNIGSIRESTIPTVSSTISQEAEELRKKAADHYVIRQQFISKAQAAYCRGMKDVASFYAQQGRDHGIKFKETNKAASTLIMKQRNAHSAPQVLDLHGLHVQEAIAYLDNFLKTELQQKQPQFGLLKVSIITGQGLHSLRGPKLRPSVIEFLRKVGYSYVEINPGVLEVYSKSDLL